MLNGIQLIQNSDYTLSVRVIEKKAWQYHFCRNMFINNTDTLDKFNTDFTIINASDVINEFKSS